ncbi:MAG: serine/threonine-protein kinase [Cyanobacteria bacterium P01_D01_bin.128]
MTAQLESDWLGKTLRDRYTIRRELSRAIGRRTLLADDLQTHQPVVIKIITFGGDFDWADLRLFEREGEVLKSLAHAAIPGYLDYFEIDLPQAKGYALVQNYVEGRSLQDYLQAGRTFTEADILDIARQLLAILHYLHTQVPPIIHRDLKPSNILLGDRSGHHQGQLYLVDFGSVQAPFIPPTGTLTIVGTYGYMPPEQFGGRAEPASDLYSLGATLIYLVTGLHPAELPQHSLRIRFESKAIHISQSLRRWLRWLTHPDISQRPTSAQAALDGLDSLLEPGTLTQADLALATSGRVLVHQHGEGLEIVLPPKGFRPRQLRSWLNLLTLGITFSIASTLASSVVWLPATLLGFWTDTGVMLLPIVWILSSAFSVVLGFTSLILVPTPASNAMLRQLHIRIDHQHLAIYRQSNILLRFQRLVFKVHRDEISQLIWNKTESTLEILATARRYVLKRHRLGLKPSEFKQVVDILSDSLGIDCQRVS